MLPWFAAAALDLPPSAAFDLTFAPHFSTPPPHTRFSLSHIQLARFLEEYMKLPNSPTKWTKLVDFLKNTYPQIINEVRGGV